MKKSIIITGILTLISVTAIQAQNMDKFEMQVDKLGCPFCAFGLEKKFKEMKGIKNVAIEIETGDFSFNYPAEKALSIEAVEKQVVKAGFTPITTIITRADGTVEKSGELLKVAVDAELANKSVYVHGNCGMCEARITKAARTIPGVASVSWNKNSKILKVVYDVSKTSMSEIEMAIANVGHDTKNHHTDDATYNSLPGCCQYERANQ